MREFQGKVAVVTGAASGIGRALAARCAREGMQVVLADIEKAPLARAAAELKDAGAAVLAVPTDVSRADDVARLARETLAAFGGVHLLCNNAGVGAGGTVWDSTHADWEWVLGVNLWGVIHGVRTFMPIMLRQDTECHVVNTASVAGLLPYHFSAPYQVTKFAVVGLSENMYFSLAHVAPKIGVSVLCPGWVRTQIMTAERNRPPELQNPPVPGPLPPEVQALYESMVREAEAGLAPEVVADSVFAAIRERQFYVIIPPDLRPFLRERLENVVQGRNPTFGVAG